MWDHHGDDAASQPQHRGDAAGGFAGGAVHDDAAPPIGVPDAIIDRIDLALPGILDLESATAWQEQLDTEQFAWILSGPETYVLTAWTKQHCLGA